MSVFKVMEASNYALERKVEYGSPEQNKAVQTIIEEVVRQKDEALRQYSERFDGVRPEKFRVESDEIEAAYKAVDPNFLFALRNAAANIRAFHEKQKRTSWFDQDENGSLLGQVLRPLNRVGIYVPGGKAAYPSSVLMNAIPAKVAGVKEIAMVTPPATGGKEGIDPNILVAAQEAGVTEIYKVGGAQAIAALAYGTESILPVDKICGPGNLYVALAKRYVFGVVDIDSIAGPTDIVVLADDSANPVYVAADMLSQAEHDEMASAILVTDSRPLAEAVQRELQRQLDALPRKTIAEASLRERGALLTVSDLQEGIRVVNRIAPSTWRL